MNTPTDFGPDMIAHADATFGATPTNRPVIFHAIRFAHDAHASINQRRKHTGDAYFVHPIAVAAAVDAAMGCDDMVAIAIMHDVVEDTPVTIDDIRAVFGDFIAAGVAVMTDPDTAAGNRAARKAMTRARFAAADPAFQVVKCADCADNAPSIRDNDPKFFTTFRAEVTAMIDGFDHSDPTVAAMVAHVKAVMG